MQPLESRLLKHDAVRHGFFARTGGVSEGIYASLNCGPGSDDDDPHVAENRARVTRALDMPEGRLQTLHQVHSNIAITVTNQTPWQTGERPQADALVTDRPGVAIGVLTADCAPVLFFEPESRIIAAAHAGWKGAVGGILESTIDAMTALGARTAHIRAAVGPCIMRASYEVSDDFRAPFIAHDPDSERFFTAGKREGHEYFDLPGYICYRLAGAGITKVEALDRDTCAEEDMFFSYRRATLRGEPDYGRQVSAIALKG